MSFSTSIASSFPAPQTSLKHCFSSNKSIYSADLLITDWSGIAAEYCFATERPALFINTKPKANNANWEKIGITPVEYVIRRELGVNIDKEQVVNADETVKELFKNAKKYQKKINDYFETFTFNHGTAAEVGAKYVLKSIVEKRKNNKD